MPTLYTYSGVTYTVEPLDQNIILIGPDGFDLVIENGKDELADIIRKELIERDGYPKSLRQEHLLDEYVINEVYERLVDYVKNNIQKAKFFYMGNEYRHI